MIKGTLVHFKLGSELRLLSFIGDRLQLQLKPLVEDVDSLLFNFFFFFMFPWYPILF